MRILVEWLQASARRLHDDERGLSTAELLGNAALAIAALVVIWGVLEALGVEVVAWIRSQMLGGWIKVVARNRESGFANRPIHGGGRVLDGVHGGADVPDRAAICPRGRASALDEGVRVGSPAPATPADCQAAIDRVLADLLSGGLGEDLVATCSEDAGLLVARADGVFAGWFPGIPDLRFRDRGRRRQGER